MDYRVYGINFDYAVWTNIEPEHIGENEHTDFDDYLNSKLKIFSMAKHAVINSFTKNYNDIVMACKKHKIPLFEKTENKLKINSESNIWITFQRVRTFLIFCVGNLFFRAISLKTSLRMLKESFKIPDNFVSLIYDIPRAKQALIGCLLFLLVLVIDYLKYKEKNVQEIISAQKPVVRWILYWFLLVNIIFAATISNQEFLYAQF